MRYERPETLESALSLLAEGPAWQVLAGGTDLYPATTAAALAGPVLDIGGIGALGGVTEDDNGWQIGATATWTDVIRAPLPPAFDALKQAAREVGSVQIQNAATLVGNLCNASPAADGVPALLILDAEVELRAAGTSRRLPLAAFIRGNRQTARAPDELAVAIHVPRAGGTGGSRFEKLGARRYLVISIAMAAARIAVEDGTIREARLAVGACSEVATRLTEIEAGLVGQAADAARIDAAEVAAALSPIDDVRATAAYRCEAAAELLARAFRGAIGSGS